MLTTMDKLLTLLLENPSRFSRSEVPCCLQGLWETALDDGPAVTSKSDPATVQTEVAEAH